jgi:hypothetical protein
LQKNYEKNNPTQRYLTTASGKRILSLLKNEKEFAETGCKKFGQQRKLHK